MIDNIPQNQRIIGLDVGDKAVGVALSDISRTVASAHAVLDRKNFIKEIKAIIEKQNVGMIIVGLPIGLDGSKGPRYQSVKAFAKNIQKDLQLPVEFQDERFSSTVVENMMLQADMSRQRRNELSDKLAAAYILQGFLDQNR